MLSSGVEPLLHSSVPTALEGLYLPGSSSTGHMAVAEPRGGLDAASEGARPALTHSDRLRGTTGVENFCQEREDLGDVLTVTSQGPTEPPPEESVEAGGLEEDEQNKKSHFRKLDCCGDGYRKEEEAAEDAEEHRAECCALAPGESWSKQEDPHLDPPEVKPWRTCCTETVGSLKSTENRVQVTAETLPKLTEEVQGMKADGTKMFSKAGYRSDGVSKGLPPESNECPDVDTVMARAGVSETSTLDFLEPLKVMDVESATEHPQETNEYNGLKAGTAMPLRTGGNIVSILETREEKLPRRNPVNEFRTSLADWQSCQQDEENNTYDFCTGPVPKQDNEPHRLSSVESCGTLSTKSSEALCSVLKSIRYLDFRNMPLENNSTAVHGFINETPKKYLPQNTESQTHYGHGTGFVENPTSSSVAVEQVSVVRREELSSAKVDPREVSARMGKSHSSGFEEAAEVRRKIAVGDNVEVGSWPEAQEGANSEHCHSSVFSSVASSPEELSKEKLKMVLSEGDKLEKDQWQFPVGDICKDNIKENSLFMETSNPASHEMGQTDTCFCNTSSKISPPSSYSCMDLSTKLEKGSPEAQLLEKESESKTTSEELAGSLVEATEHNSNDSLSGGKETSLIYTLNVCLPPVAQKSREPHHNECPCTVNEVSSRDKARNNLSGKESIGASGTTQEQVTEIVLHKDNFKSSLCSRTSDDPKMTSKISQKNMKSSVGNTENVVTASVNEHGDTWNCNNQSIKEECTAASASCVLSGSTRVDDVLLNSHTFNVEVDEKIEENDNLEGETSVGYNSKKVIIFPEVCSPLACGSLPCEGEGGNRGVDLHGVNDIVTAKSMFCSAHTAEKATATLVRDEISNKNMEVVKQFDLCKVTDGSEIVCDRDEAKDQTGMCALQADGFDKIRTVDSSKAPEGNHRNKSNERLLVRYLKKETCVHNFGFCNSSLCPRRELDTYKKKQVSSLAANPSECSVSATGTCPLFSKTNIQTQRAAQTEKTLHPMENQCLASQSEFEGPVTGNKHHLESLNNQADTVLQTMATSGEETKISIGSRQSEEILIKTGGDLPLLVHKYAKDTFQGTLKENVVDLDSLNGVRNEDCSGYMGFTSDLIEKKTVELKEHKNGCEREDKGTLEESFSDSKSHSSQHTCSIKCAKGSAELLFAGNRMQPSLPKIKWLVEDQENTVSTQFLPFSSVHGSLSYKPENMNVLSETETKKSLRGSSILNNSCPQLTFEPGKETEAQKHIGPSCFGKFDIQESFNETQADSERPSALSLGITLPEKEELWMSSENTQRNNCDSSSAKVFSKDSSVTKLSVPTSVKRKGSNIEIPSSENETKTSFLTGAKSSRVCAPSKESLREEGHSMLTVKDMNVTSPKSAHCGEKFKDTSVEEKMGGEVASRKMPINSFLDGEDDCLQALLEDSKESGSKIVPLDTEVLEEIPRADLNNLLKERGNATELGNLAGTSLLSDAVRDCQAEDASDAEASPKLQYNTTPTIYACTSMFSNSCKESSPNCVVCSEACVPYKLHAQSKDNVKEVAEGQDTVTTRSGCKENEASGSERLDQIQKCQVLKQKKHEKMGIRLSDKAQQKNQKSQYQEKAKITLQPSMLHGSELLRSSSHESVTRNMKFDGPSEEIFAVRNSENQLCSTLEEVKRPKITTDIISSQFLKTQDSEMENLNLNLGYDGIPGAFETTNKLRGPLPLKRQPGRTCKKVPTSYQLKSIRKSKKIRSSPISEIPPEIFPKQENTLLKSLCSPCSPPTMETETAMRCVRMPRQRAKRCSLLNSLKFRKCTKEPALLGKLSAMASKLLAPAQSIQNLKPQPYSSEILPVAERYSQRRSKNLLEAFSCINRSVHSRWADSWCTKMFSFQPLALYPVESTKILFSDLSHKPPTSFLETPVFPISFHIKLDSSPVTDRTGITSQHSVQHGPVWGEMSAPPSEWTFSFLLSQSWSDTTVYKEGSSLANELRSSLSVTSPRTVALRRDRRRNAVAERRGRCSMLGLHTVLALSSPGCYRIWTRRRNLTSHIPTIQRLFISQFAQGLKGARYPTSVSDDLVSSLPYSLGRVLSIWSQHGPSARPSEITPLHSSHCKWQPSVGIENSYAVLPHLPVQSMEALQAAGREIRLETSFPLPLPKSCALPESLPSPPRLPAPELHICALDEADASVPACLRSQDDTEPKKIESEKRPKKVSQIRIRKTVPKPDPNLTPMGLPKPKRLKKKEFSLEEIYTNKNYKSPPPARSLETIFEEPKEKNGRLISVSQQKRKRILEFQDFTLPRKRKTRGKIKAVGSFTRAKKAALQSAELDALLIQKLMDLEAFFATEAEEEQASGI
ncbi:PREDICTED: protein PRR14L isoform X1 [Calidris pugnax]|uniref:protein PRR14L isoform X1 n=1 Tax=Calidris pugnax TaxID=198806 RepID=UPI00071CE8A6|nr:PREDICTED: protein PRR14L isoform X1 [Calidris pugnax]XP_014818645.1 PREDICTED: protein PRR14L isoform X1 [Calidris pugnax]